MCATDWAATWAEASGFTFPPAELKTHPLGDGEKTDVCCEDKFFLLKAVWCSSPQGFVISVYHGLATDHWLLRSSNEIFGLGFRPGGRRVSAQLSQQLSWACGCLLSEVTFEPDLSGACFLGEGEDEGEEEEGGLRRSAFPLWDLYFNFEERGRRWKRLGCLLQRALAIPMQGLPAVRVRLRSLILGDAAPPLEALCSETDTPTMERMLGAKSEEKDRSCNIFQESDEEVGTVSHSVEENNAAPPSHPPPPAEATELEDGELHEEDDSDQDGEIHEEEEPPATVQHEAAVPVAGFSSVGAQRPPNTDSTSLVGKGSTVGAVARFKGAEELDASDRAEHFLSLREELWNKTSSEAAVLMQYEAPLHRQYFHNKPLSQAQLDAWRCYLDFEESRHPRDWRRLSALFERCLVVTNNYLEFWLRYARALTAMEVQGSCKPEAACKLLRGACLNGRLSRRPDALAAWAELEEQCGRPHRAGALLDAALQTCGMGSTELAIRRVALEMRRSDVSSAASLLEKFVLQTVNLNSRSFLSRRYARLMEDCQRQPNKAAKFLMDAWKAGCRDSGLLLELTLRAKIPRERVHIPCIAVDVSSHAHGFGRRPRQAGEMHGSFRGGHPCRYARNVPILEEVSQLWACYVDFLLTHGASLEILHNVQDRARRFRCRCQAVPPDTTGPPVTPTKKRRSSDLSPEKTTGLMAVKQAGAQQRSRMQRTWITDPAERECIRQCSIAAEHGTVLGTCSS
eukprot:s3675_g3.t2